MFCRQIHLFRSKQRGRIAQKAAKSAKVNGDPQGNDSIAGQVKWFIGDRSNIEGFLQSVLAASEQSTCPLLRYVPCYGTGMASAVKRSLHNV
jgi:hypothetical protein